LSRLLSRTSQILYLGEHDFNTPFLDQSMVELLTIAMRVAQIVISRVDMLWIDFVLATAKKDE
jgi:hypothetical protein